MFDGKKKFIVDLKRNQSNEHVGMIARSIFVAMMQTYERVDEGAYLPYNHG